MNYKDKIEKILRPAFKEGGEVPLIYTFKMVKLIEQAQRDAVMEFTNWVYENYNEGEIKMYGDGGDLSINLLCRFYLNQTKEDLNPKEGE